MPKSSSDRRHADIGERAQDRHGRVGVVHDALSVISRISRAAGTPASTSARPIFSGRLASLTLRADRLTATVRSIPASVQRAALAQRLAQDDVGQRIDQAGRLGQRDERVRAQQAQVGMAPRTRASTR